MVWTLCEPGSNFILFTYFTEFLSWLQVHRLNMCWLVTSWISQPHWVAGLSSSKLFWQRISVLFCTSLSNFFLVRISPVLLSSCPHFCSCSLAFSSATLPSATMVEISPCKIFQCYLKSLAEIWETKLKNQVPGTRYQVPSTRHETPGPAPPTCMNAQGTLELPRGHLSPLGQNT